MPRFSPVVPSPFGESDARAWLAGHEPARRDGRGIDNLASQRVAERCGFVREGVLRSHVVMRSTGARRDSVIYGLLAQELR